MKQILSLTLFTALLASQSVWATKPLPPVCQSNLADEEVINTNARIDADKYSRPNARPIARYKQFLDTDYAKLVDELGPDDVAIDSGGGYGVMGLELAATKGVETYVINAQDFWTYFKTRHPGTDLLADLANVLPVKTEDLPIFWEEQGGVRYRTFKKMEYKDWELLKGRIETLQEELVAKKKFNYLVGFAESKLPTITKRAKILTDLYGAYTYSVDRLALLNLYYAALAENGRGFIRTMTNQDLFSFSKVRTKNGEIDLEPYLINRFPSIFMPTARLRAVLAFKRDPNIPILDLKKYLKIDYHEIVQRGGMDYPEIWLKEINP